MASEDHQGVKKKEKKEKATFKEQGHVRRTEDLHITMQIWFMFPFCACGVFWQHGGLPGFLLHAAPEFVCWFSLLH